MLEEALWHQVNPGLAHGYPDIAGLRDKAKKAEHSPGDRDGFQQFNLNVWLDKSTSSFVDMTVYEAYQGLETGLIDCTQTYPYLVEALRFNEVFDSYTALDYGQIGALGIMMNKDSFDMLPPEQQEALMATGEGLADEFGRILTAANERSVQILRDQGTPVLSISDEDRDRMASEGEKYIDEWVQRADGAGLDGQALVDEFTALVAEYTALRDAEGYPWDSQTN